MTRIALAGLGAAARNIHLPACRRLDHDLQIVGGCDADAVTRARAPRGVGPVFASVDEMIDAVSPDIVAVLTDPASHAALCERALARGCHVFCEKPFAPSLAEMDRVLQAADAASRLVVVNNQFRFMQVFRASRALIGSARFGNLLFASVTQTQTPHDGGETGWRGALERRVGFEFGVHVFDTLRYLFGEEPVRLFAHMPRPSGIVADAINVVVLTFAQGRSATVVLNRLSRGPARYLDVSLTGDRASVEASIGGEVRLSLGLHTAERRPFVAARFVQGAQARLLSGQRSTLIATDPINPLASATAANLQDMLRCLRTGEEPECSGRRNRATMALVFKAYESAERGCPVEI